MQDFWNFAGHFWWLVFPLAGMAGGWAKAVSRANERRHQHRMEMYRLKHPQPVTPSPAPVPDVAPGEVEKLLADHDAVNRRWLDYELDVAKLIDFPMMTDVREPLTVAFLRAKREADRVRPADPAEVATRTRLEEYRKAVTDFEVAFDVAEREAKRIRDTGFDEPERQRLATARKLVTLAEDEAASPAERQTAYKRARRELEGLIVLPDVTIASLEEKVARMIGQQ
ncbi:hypothetical protein [Specibacter cremeus]|uniref:hypothetical protein n=1 Tax=Specibacter cremeus TaxID=1629051 RepID=UPI000F7AD873|nr:hypothetical protein [Specibacter cremeus]